MECRARLERLESNEKGDGESREKGSLLPESDNADLLAPIQSLYPALPPLLVAPPPLMVAPPAYVQDLAQLPLPAPFPVGVQPAVVSKGARRREPPVGAGPREGSVAGEQEDPLLSEDYQESSEAEGQQDSPDEEQVVLVAKVPRRPPSKGGDG